MVHRRPHQYKALRPDYSIGSLPVGVQQATVDGVNQFAAVKGQKPDFNGFLDAYLGKNNIGAPKNGWGSTGDAKHTPELPLREKMQAAMGFVDTQALGLNKEEIRAIGKIQGLEGMNGEQLGQALATAGVRPDVVDHIMSQKDPAQTVGKIHDMKIIDGKVGPVTRAAWAEFMGKDGPGQKFAANPNAPTSGAQPPSPAYTQGQLGNKPQVTGDMLSNGAPTMTPPQMEGPVKKVTPQGMKAEQAAAPVEPAATPQAAAPKGDKLQVKNPDATGNDRISGAHDMFKDPGGKTQTAAASPGQQAGANVFDPNTGTGGGTMVAPKPEVGGAPNTVKTVRISAPAPH